MNRVITSIQSITELATLLPSDSVSPSEIDPLIYDVQAYHKLSSLKRPADKIVSIFPSDLSKEYYTVLDQWPHAKTESLQKDLSSVEDELNNALELSRKKEVLTYNLPEIDNTVWKIREALMSKANVIHD